MLSTSPSKTQLAADLMHMTCLAKNPLLAFLFTEVLSLFIEQCVILNALKPFNFGL